MSAEPLALGHDGRHLLDLSRTPHVRADGVTHRGLTDASVRSAATSAGTHEIIAEGRLGDSELTATVTVVVADSVTGTVADLRLIVHNRGSHSVAVTEADALCARLADGEWTAHAMRSSWGAEFDPLALDLGASLEIGSRTGRSSLGWHPWVAFERADGGAFVVSPAWSGNWRVLFDPLQHTRIGTVTAGISPWSFSPHDRCG